MNADSTSATTVSVVTVTFRQGEEVRPALEAVAGQLREGDQLIVVDNASGDETPAIVRDAAPSVRLIQSDENTGFPAACNRGAAAAGGELLVFLNPDAVPAPGWRDAIERPLHDGSGWSAWQALVTAEQGRVVNTHGGIVHFTGIAWAGGAGEPTPAQPGTEPTVLEPGFASGACLAIPRGEFERLGGFAQDFFLYHEDVDLSLRVRLAGGTLGVVAEARVDHAYEFDKGAAKWLYLERNRWATLIRVYPAALLVLLAPALLATELALVPASILGGWFGQKARAWGQTLRALPRLLGERRAIQRGRVIGARQFAAGLTVELSSAYLGAAGRSRVVAGLLRAYWRAVSFLLRA